MGIADAAVGQPLSVKPDEIDLTVVRHELPQLLTALVAHLQSAVAVQLRHKVAGEAPVHRRVIEADLQALGAAGFHILAHKIPMGGRIHAVVGADLAVEETEAVVMARCEHHIFHAGLLCRPRPGRRVEGRGGEALRKPGIVGGVDPLHEHGPFAAAQQRVQAPVQEHTVFRVAEPLELFLRLGRERGGMVAVFQLL